MKNFSIYQKIFVLFSVMLILMVISSDLAAQCPMCRIGPETNHARGGSEAAGLNKGILFLLGMPYLLVGTGVYILWRKKRD